MEMLEIPCPATVEGPSPLEIEITIEQVITVLLHSVEDGGTIIASDPISTVSIMLALLHLLPG